MRRVASARPLAATTQEAEVGGNAEGLIQSTGPPKTKQGPVIVCEKGGGGGQFNYLGIA